jgi:hypothetical protein
LPIDFEQGQAKQIGREIGPALVHAVAPLLTPDDLTDARIDNIFRFFSEAPAPSILQLLPVLLPLRPDIKERVAKAIRRALMDRRYDFVWSASHALQRWAALVVSAGAIPEALVDQLLIAIQSRQEAGLYALLYCGRQLLRRDQLSSPQQATLTEALSDLFAQTSYESELPQALRASISIVRAECVRVAKELADRGLSGEGISLWLDAHKNDPLAEVRFALEHTESEVWP